MQKMVMMKACPCVLSVIVLAALGSEARAAGEHAWTGADVGKVGAAGSYSEKDGVFTLNGAGGGVYVAGDAFHYVYLPLQGDGEIIVRAKGLKNAVANTTLGLMARETLEYDSRDVYLFLRPNRGYLAACQARTDEDIESVRTVAKDTGAKLPCWLRMTRRGDIFHVFLSPDGKEWRPFGSVTNGMSEHIYIGMLVCSHRTNLLTEAVFDNVSVSGAIPPMGRFKEEVAKTLKRLAGEKPRNSRLDAFDALAVKRRGERASLVFAKRKKLISANVQTMPPLSEFKARLREYEQRLFDGVVFPLTGGQRPFQRRAWDEGRFIGDYAALAAMESRILTDNFVLVQTSATMDWFDDRQWQSALRNTRMLAKAALLGRCAGLFIDPEGYGANPWSYFDAVGKDEKTFDEFSAQVKKRGEEWVRAIEEELPSPRLLFAFLMPTTRLMDDLDYPVDNIKKDIPRMRYALLPSFVNGVLKGAGPNTVLIDGNEHAYYFRAEEQYKNFVRYVRETLPQAFVDEELRAKYPAHVQAGSSLYPNFCFGAHSRTLSRHMTAEERSKWYEHNLYWALKTADEYVWDWMEGPLSLWAAGENWAKGGNLPPLYVEAIRSARDKVVNNEALGFDAASLFAAVKSRAAEKRPTAKIRKIEPGKAPMIDGRLDDAAWQEAEFLSPFIPMLGWRQEVQMETKAKIRYDENALYVAFVCGEDRPHGMRAKTTKRDDYFLVQDDNVQILIASPEKEPRVYRFVLNSQGVGYDAVCRRNSDQKACETEAFVLDLNGFNSAWKSAVQILPDSWNAEAMIPWKDLNMRPEQGAKILVNLGRFRTQGLNGDRTYWAPVLEMQGDYLERMEPELFGAVILQ